MKSPSFITVFVQARSGADHLPALYESLLEQSFRDFELLVVDDGTVESGKSLSASWQVDGRIKIRHLHQERPGRHVAYNQAIAAVETELFVALDPGDRFVPGALDIIASQWAAIAEKDRYAGMLCLCSRENRDIVGTPFSRIDTNNFEMRMIDGVTGEKGYLYQASKLREYSLPDIEGEIVPEAILHNRVSRGNLFRCIPQALIVKQESPDGAAAAKAPRNASINARILQFNELNYFPMPSKLYLTVNSQYVQLSLLNGRKLGAIVRNAIGKRSLFIVAFIAGFLSAAQALRRKRASGRATR